MALPRASFTELSGAQTQALAEKGFPTTGYKHEPLPGLLHAFSTDGLLCLLLSARAAASE